MACEDCGNPDANAWLSDVLVCDRCYDNRIAEHTGLARLPDPPPPVLHHGPDGRGHRLRFKIWRAPTGIDDARTDADIIELSDRGGRRPRPARG